MFTLTYPGGRRFGFTDNRSQALRLAGRFGLIVTTVIFGTTQEVTQ